MLDNQNKNSFKKLKLSIYSKIIKTLIENVYRMSKHWMASFTGSTISGDNKLLFYKYVRIRN